MENLVECHSGFDYAEYPVAFHWEGQRIKIETIIAEWRTPEQKIFRIQTEDGGIFKLVYDQTLDAWDVVGM
jgi:hypothetical protein